MIAFLVKLSSLMFGSALGVRFAAVILQLLTLCLMWEIAGHKDTDRKSIYIFFLVAFSLLFFNVFGFIATPDAPLLFFTTFFLYAYKNYLERARWIDAILVAVCVAGLVYSKYQSFLLLGIVIISNPGLLRSVKFLTAMILALILLTPHIYWQVYNGFPGIRYHLIDRAGGFSYKNILEYLPVQFALFNPFILGSAIYIMVRNRAKDLFTKTLYNIIIWIPAFFGAASLRGHVEPHWTALCSVPVIIVVSSYLENQAVRRFLLKSLIPSFIIIMVARVLVLTDAGLVKNLGLNGKNEKFEFIGSVAGDLPVAFPGSYPYPALYSFFTGKEAFALNSFSSRMTQYDIWQKERIYNNKPVFVCGYGEGDSQLYRKGGIEFYGYKADSLQTVNRMLIRFEPRISSMVIGDSIGLTLSITNTYEYDVDFSHHDFPVTVYMGFINNSFRDYFPVEMNEPVGVIRAGDTVVRKALAVVPDIKPGKYNFGICLITLTGAAINDSFYPLTVKAKNEPQN
jgi:hypothetical protein